MALGRMARSVVGRSSSSLSTSGNEENFNYTFDSVGICPDLHLDTMTLCVCACACVCVCVLCVVGVAGSEDASARCGTACGMNR